VYPIYTKVASEFFVCTAPKINNKFFLFQHERFFMENTFAAPAFIWYIDAASLVKTTLMSGVRVGLGHGSIPEELTMATDKDTTTRTVKDAAEDVTKATRGAAMEAADAGRKVTRDAADTMERNIDKGAEAATRTAERSAEATRDVAEKSAQALRSTTEQATETASKITSDAAEATRKVTDQTTQQFGRVFNLQAKASEEVANRTQQNLDVLLQTSSLLAEGFQSVLREWMSYTQSAVQRNIDGMNTIMRARTMQDLLAAQSDLLNAEVQLLLNSSVKVSEVTARVANDAAQKINVATKEQARKTA
jgi:hypothetical protein